METRSFADYLRTLDDAALISLFAHRPDLVTPVPPDVASLAVRASSAPSLARLKRYAMYWASSDCELRRAVVKGLSSAGLAL